MPAGHQQLRVLQEALEPLPEGVEQARLRSDTAGYQQESLKYCAEGQRPRFGVEVIQWLRQRCGKSEEAHGIMKEDLAGGKLPSGDFGENAAWWGITVLAYNLNVAMQRVALGEGWVGKRLKAMRFGLISLAGRVVKHARGLSVRLRGGHPGQELLLAARLRILALAQGPSG